MYICSCNYSISCVSTHLVDHIQQFSVILSTSTILTLFPYIFFLIYLFLYLQLDSFKWWYGQCSLLIFHDVWEATNTWPRRYMKRPTGAPVSHPVMGLCHFVASLPSTYLPLFIKLFRLARAILSIGRSPLTVTTNGKTAFCARRFTKQFFYS